jgi:predicted ThiF/HesA family dinucleotide-utilizing enzyme
MSKALAFIAIVSFGLLGPVGAQEIPAGATEPLPATGAYPVRQDASQWLGSNLIGAKVVSASDGAIGHIANLIVNQNGAVEAAVISVGGVLGIGNKDVAVTYKSMSIARTKDGNAIDHVTVAATKTDLEQAPPFQPLSRQQKLAEQKR